MQAARSISSVAAASASSQQQQQATAVSRDDERSTGALRLNCSKMTTRSVSTLLPQANKQTERAGCHSPCEIFLFRLNELVGLGLGTYICSEYLVTHRFSSRGDRTWVPMVIGLGFLPQWALIQILYKSNGGRTTETRHAGKHEDTTPKRGGSLLNYLEQTQTMARKFG